MRRRDFVLAFLPETPAGYSPYRLRDRKGREVEEVNAFLDAQALRGLSPRSLRAYGYSLLDAWQWLVRAKQALEELDEARLGEYIRFQQSSEVKPAPATVNHRLTALSCLYRFHLGDELPCGAGVFRSLSHPYHSSAASPTGYLYPARRRRGRLRLRNRRRVVVPLAVEEVRRFLESLRSWRDLAITGLMLLSGLRSREVVELELGDLDEKEHEVRVHGKGAKERLVPYAGDLALALRAYLATERPENASSSKLFVSLKGRRRGDAMTLSGLRSLFRHHRRVSKVEKGNPHRWRHTFGAEMVRAGISLPALMKLMGHSDVHTTMRYVELSARDVREEFVRVTKKRTSSFLFGLAGHDGKKKVSS